MYLIGTNGVMQLRNRGGVRSIEQVSKRSEPLELAAESGPVPKPVMIGFVSQLLRSKINPVNVVNGTYLSHKQHAALCRNLSLLKRNKMSRKRQQCLSYTETEET